MIPRDFYCWLGWRTLLVLHYSADGYDDNNDIRNMNSMRRLSISAVFPGNFPLHSRLHIHFNDISVSKNNTFGEISLHDTTASR